MDGLETVEILKSTIISENVELRIESEYYLKQYLQLNKIISSISNDKISNFAYVTDGIHTSIDFDDKSNINLLSAKSPKDNFFDLSGNGYISEIQHVANQRTSLKKDDIIISTVGTIGNCAVVDSTVLPANSDRHVGIIRIRNDYKSHYVSTFLLSKYGNFQSKRYTTGNVQPNLFIDKINRIIVPFISEPFQNRIENLVVYALDIRVQSKRIYDSATHILFSELSMNEFKPSQQSVSIKSLSDSFSTSGRLDAEYYQPKYADYESFLKTSETVNTLCNIHDKSFAPKSGTQYKYIELANVGNAGNINDVETILGEDLPSRARRRVKVGQVIIASVEGSLQSCALITDEYNGALCSTGFYVLDSININSETLLVLFKSKPIQELLKQRCSGTILTAITKEELLSMPLPKICEKVQKQIAEKVQESFSLRRQSEQLLESAKRAVEIAIEQSEEKALEWLSDIVK